MAAGFATSHRHLSVVASGCIVSLLSVCIPPSHLRYPPRPHPHRHDTPANQHHPVSSRVRHLSCGLVRRLDARFPVLVPVIERTFLSNILTPNPLRLLFLPLILAASGPDPGPNSLPPRQNGVDGGGPGGSGKRPEYVAHPAGELVCRPFGECEPCPSDEVSRVRHEPTPHCIQLQWTPRGDQSQSRTRNRPLTRSRSWSRVVSCRVVSPGLTLTAQLDQPFCMPFGNRRLLHCQDPRKPDKGEVPAWEACGKVVRKEKQDFYEFVVSGLVGLGLGFVFVIMPCSWSSSSSISVYPSSS
jgi:hypothetical protein